MALVRDRKDSFLDHEGRGLGDVAEAVFILGIDKGGWFGAGTEILPSTDYDDLQNGVDLLAERRGEDGAFSHFALGIDITASVDSVETKINKTLDNLRKGFMGKVDYFSSPRMGIKGQLQDVPHGVVGLGKEQILELAKCFPGQEQVALTHKIEQFIVLEELRVQLSAMVEYIRTGTSTLVTAEKKARMIEKYQQALSFVEQVLASKDALKQQLFADERDYRSVLQSDPVYKVIAQVSQQISGRPSSTARRPPSRR